MAGKADSPKQLDVVLARVPRVRQQPGGLVRVGRNRPFADDQRIVAFEFNGPAWRVIEQRIEMGVTPDPEYPTLAYSRALDWSRLIPIDAAIAPEPLRRRYATAPVIVVPAVIRMRYRTSKTEGPSVWGEVDSLVSSDVTVPARLRGRPVACWFIPAASRSPARACGRC